MCRWLAYYGSPIRLEELLFKPSARSSTRACTRGSAPRRRTATASAWAGTSDEDETPARLPQRPPGLERPQPPRARRAIRSPLSCRTSGPRPARPSRRRTPIRSATASWLWMHNGAIREFRRSSRELRLAVDPSLYPSIEGTTDSETMFYLALTFGLEDDPAGAVERMVGFVERPGAAHGVEHPIQMTVATSDGEPMGVPLLERGRIAILFFSTALDALRGSTPRSRSCSLSDESRLVVSEPLATSRARGTRCPSRVGASSRRVRTRSTPSRLRPRRGLAPLSGAALAATLADHPPADHVRDGRGDPDDQGGDDVGAGAADRDIRDDKVEMITRRSWTRVREGPRVPRTAGARAPSARRN